MIRAEIDGIDTSKYIYDTGLTFGVQFGEKILDKIKTNLDEFPIKHNFDRGHNPGKLARMIGIEKTRELYRRIDQMKNTYDGNIIHFTQYDLPEYLTQELYTYVPNALMNAFNSKPSTILQISKEGQYLGIHKGHKRSASLFMLLQGNDQETRWYRNKEQFDVIDQMRIPDYDKVEHVVTAIMQPFKWYVFNHYEWHSVHKFTEGCTRINIGIDFFDTSAEELVEIVKNNS